MSLPLALFFFLFLFSLFGGTLVQVGLPLKLVASCLDDSLFNTFSKFGRK
jgi:hypothetical protein